MKRELSEWDKKRNASVTKQRREDARIAIRSLRHHRASGVCREIDLMIIESRVRELIALYRATMHCCGPQITTYGN